MTDTPESPYASRTLLIWLFVLMMLAFMLLAWRSQTNDDNIRGNTERVAATQLVICLDRNVAVEHLDNLIDELVVSVQTSSSTEAEKVERIRRYNAAKLTLIECPQPMTRTEST